MGLRFWRRMKIAPGLTLNLSKSGVSLSAGPRGAKVTVGPRGVRRTVGIPGTGIFYTTTSSASRPRRPAAPIPRARSVEDKLTLGFFQKLVTPPQEKAFVDGCRRLHAGNTRRALQEFMTIRHPDGQFLAGVLALKRRRYAEAASRLLQARKGARSLGALFNKYGLVMTFRANITPEVAVEFSPNVRGVLLMLTEAYQELGRPRQAADCLVQLRRFEPDDVAVKLSLAELFMAVDAQNKKTCQRVVKLAEGVQNQSEVHAALLLYKAKALRRLGLNDAARQVLTQTLRKKKNRSEELLKALRYERALVYDALGRTKRSRADLELLYSRDPDFQDVAQRLGVP